MSDDARELGPLDLPLYKTGFPASDVYLQGGPMFWEEIQRLSAGEALGEFVDEHLDQPAAPRVCVVLGPPDGTAARTAALMMVARSLGRRGRRTIVIDGDDTAPDLTRWAGRSDREGWIDVVRYGVSPAAAGVALPWQDPGGLLLGVGSYHPTRATPDEVRGLVDGLLETTDVVLIGASTGDRGAVWAAVPSVRVLCWDRAAIDDSLCELLVRDAGLLGEAPAAALVFPTGAQSELAGKRAEAAAPAGSSPVFRSIAVFLIALVVVLGSWWLGLRHRSSEPMPETLVEAGGATRDTASEVAGGAGPDSVLADTVPATPPGTGPETAATLPPAAGAVVPAAGEAAADTSEERGGGAVAGTPAPSGGTPDAADPFAGPVGTDVWCLHVYSFDDSLRAVREVSIMAHHDVVGRIHSEYKGKRHLFRVYAGNFPTRAAALAAKPELLRRLRTDWAMPARSSRFR